MNMREDECGSRERERDHRSRSRFHRSRLMHVISQDKSGHIGCAVGYSEQISGSDGGTHPQRGGGGGGVMRGRGLTAFSLHSATKGSTTMNGFPVVSSRLSARTSETMDLPSGRGVKADGVTGSKCNDMDFRGRRASAIEDSVSFIS